MNVLCGWRARGAAVSTRSVDGGDGGKKKLRKSTTGLHTLSPSPLPLRPRRCTYFVGSVEVAGWRGNAPIGTGPAERPVGAGGGRDRYPDGHAPPPATAFGGLGSTGPRPPPPPTVRPAHWRPPRFSIATLIRPTGRTHRIRTLHRVLDDRRRLRNLVGTLYTKPVPISRPRARWSHSLSARPPFRRHRRVLFSITI